MYHKNIKLTVQKQLKKQFPNRKERQEGRKGIKKTPQVQWTCGVTNLSGKRWTTQWLEREPNDFTISIS